MKILITTFLILLVSINAHAAEETESVVEDELDGLDEDSQKEETSTNSTDAEFPYKPRTALLLSLWPTFGGAVVGGGILLYDVFREGVVLESLMIVGISVSSLALVVGPSIGHLYARNFKRAGWGMAIRLVLGGLIPLCAFGAVTGTLSGSIVTVVITTAGMVGASVGLLVHTIYSIVKAPQSAREANEAFKRKNIDISISPTVLKGNSDSPVMGLSVFGTF